MSVQWQESVFNALMDLVVGFWNFKVRINAALALMSPPTREDYAQFYCPVWVSLLSALENAQNMHDYTEYKHRDVLIEQVIDFKIGFCIGIKIIVLDFFNIMPFD